MKLYSKCVKEINDLRTTKPHQLPIYATSSYAFENIEEGISIFENPSKAHIYSRFSNPTIDTVAKKIALLEAHDTPVMDPWAVMTSSGMSAIATLALGLLQQGDKIMTMGNLYGGTTELLVKLLAKYGIETVLCDLRDTEACRKILRQEPAIRLIYFETPSNPTLTCVDIASVSKLAKEFDILSAIDNTFCTPIVQQPFRYDIDFVIHSTTKYLNGHGNGISGIIIGAHHSYRQNVWGAMKLLGTNCNAWDAWLTNLGLKTLAIRMERHSENSTVLAQFLNKHEKVNKVYHLSLKDHPEYEIGRRQMIMSTGMMCFEVAGGVEGGKRFMNAQTMGTLAPTMGDVDTLILHPASMSHLHVPRDIRMNHGIRDGLIRVSVGIEDVEDLIEDFGRALELV